MPSIIIMSCIAIAAGTASCLLALVLLRQFGRRKKEHRPERLALQPGPSPTIFLFRGQKLVDATRPARLLLERIGTGDGHWPDLMRWISPRFPDFAHALGENNRTGIRKFCGPDPHGEARLSVSAEHLGKDTLRITLVDPDIGDAGVVVDTISLRAMEEELDMLRRTLDRTPMLVWRQDADEQVTWANAAYLRRAEAHFGENSGWPLPRLLDIPQAAPGAATTGRRAALGSGGTMSWYDCNSHPMGREMMHVALPADAAVRAERSLREFVQTLTKTFADLPIGLAIFDRQRQLQLFNPALIDLTGLSSSFLTAQPSLFDLLDALRERRMVPEPKNYHSWRQQMNELESAATIGHHVETWSLPGGQTYRVTGRPHPDGAVAFLFEDITSEISLTRKFRADLTLGESILDGLDDALAVFGANGQMLQTNQAYRNRWATEARSLVDCIAEWERRVEPGPGFTALTACLRNLEPSEHASGMIATTDGHLMRWSVSRLGGAKTLLQFRNAELEIPRRTSEPNAPVQPRRAGETL